MAFARRMQGNQGPLKETIKRLLDIFVSTLGLVSLSPVLAILCLLVRLKMGTPVFFRQDRAGLFGRPFRVLKFRTMSTIRDANGELLADAERLTKLGKFLRRYSLDELPQLWNIWVGDMSLVGPRPLLAKYVGCYSAEQARRLEVKPGLTGWAQICGRNALSWDERFKLDVWYVDHWNLLLDVKILCKTARNILQQEGISPEGHATMPEFTGNQSVR